MEAEKQTVKEVHHRIVQDASLYLCLVVRPGWGRENTERDTPSRGRRDSVSVVLVGGRGSIKWSGGDCGDNGDDGVGEREGSGDV